MRQTKFTIFILVGFCICCTSAISIPRRFIRSTNEEQNAAWNATNTDKLKRDLMASYDKFVRPAEAGNATVVYFSPSFHHFSLDEAKSILISHCWIRMKWKDEKLKWNKSEYGGLNLFHLADHEIWQPDVVPYNSAEGSTVDIYGNTESLVSSDGTVLWVPPTVLRTFCSLDFQKWPYDTHVCSIKFGSWVHHGMDLDLQLDSPTPDTEIQLNNTEWKLVAINQSRSETIYACCPNEPYVDLTYSITISRQGAIYKTLVISPITVIVLMTLATFWLPAASSEKITLGAVTILIISIFLLYFSYKVPALAGGAPLIASFYSSSLYLVALSIVVSVVVINLAATRHGKPLPWIVKTHLNGKFGQLLLFHSISFQNAARKISRSMGDNDNSDNQPVISQENDEDSDNTQNDWAMFATAIDRITFLVYCLLFSSYALAYLT